MPRTTPTTLIIGDIHHHFQRAEDAISHFGADRTVFVGDYFDNFGDTPSVHAKTAKWFAWSCAQRNREHLIGNHDPYYFTGADHYYCPGNEENKCQAGLALLKPFFPCLRTHLWLASDVLVTHAGLHPARAHPVLPLGQYLDQQEKSFKNACTHRLNHPWFEMGTRGGFPYIGGPLWCDWKDLEPIEGLHQILGHTHVQGPTTKCHCGNTWHVNLDGGIVPPNTFATHPGGYALLKNRTLTLFNHAFEQTEVIELPKTKKF